MALSIGEVCAI